MVCSLMQYDHLDTLLGDEKAAVCCVSLLQSSRGWSYEFVLRLCHLDSFSFASEVVLVESDIH
jgi:hypothetical protein